MMKHTYIALLASTAILITALSGCGSETSESASIATDTAASGAQGQNQSNQTQIVGLVTEIFGNSLTLQVGEAEGGIMLGGGGASGGERPQGEDGEMPEDFEGGERPQGEDGEMPEGFEGGERPQGGDGEMPEDFEGGERPSGSGDGANAGGAGMAGATEEQDFSEIITLTDEEVSYTIPVDAPVTQSGTEMTFSQITKDMYISISLDENEQIVSINILG